MSDQLKNQVNQNANIDQTLLIRDVKENRMDINAIKGSWAWSKWQNYTVTANSKSTIQIVTAAILSTIPYVGWAAGALAAVYIQYNLKTGYFSSRIGNALDTDPNYYWSKRQVRLYKDSARKNLLSEKTSKASRALVPTS
ncbi:hypothetical protein MXL46_20700 [Heyndrickxia sporothermodurans]|uniref:hypothetical protein n=1 Tax=Bacilli TaxID=91061 RepID=UPI0012E2D367|nr:MULTISPECIES: hypothetical protein [Bacilli]MEB6551431.1 hypothetical protein [Heyndrickxia sporothermodurans]QGU39452.1 hypothetical protein F5989_00005 [Streptococcus mutans]